MKKKDNKPAALDHALYEMIMLVNALLELNRMGLKPHESSGWLEVFAVHCRNLNEFFGEKNGSGGHMKPVHFFADWTHPYVLNLEIVRRANSQVAHLTYNREKPEEKTGWPLQEYFTSLRDPCVAFLNRVHADPQLMAYNDNKARTVVLLDMFARITFVSNTPSNANIAPVYPGVSRSYTPPDGSV